MISSVFNRFIGGPASLNLRTIRRMRRFRSPYRETYPSRHVVPPAAEPPQGNADDGRVVEDENVENVDEMLIMLEVGQAVCLQG